MMKQRSPVLKDLKIYHNNKTGCLVKKESHPEDCDSVAELGISTCNVGGYGALRSTLRSSETHGRHTQSPQDASFEERLERNRGWAGGLRGGPESQMLMVSHLGGAEGASEHMWEGLAPALLWDFLASTCPTALWLGPREASTEQGATLPLFPISRSFLAQSELQFQQVQR